MARKAASESGGKARAPRKPKTDLAAPGGSAAAGAGDNSRKRNPDEMREAFLQHRSTGWLMWKSKRAVVDKLEVEVKAALKADGFTVKQFEIADQLTTLKGEVKVTAEVSDRLKVAYWIGHPMGKQLDLFGQPDRTPAADVAYDKGKMASMQNVPARPGYAPETEQYARYMAGYHDHQRELAGGIKAPVGGEDASSMAHAATE